MTAVQLAAVLAAILTAVVLVATRAQARRLPLPGAVGGRGMQGVVIVVGAASLVVAAAATAALTARSEHARSAPPPPAKTVIVLDVSGSLSSGVYGSKLARAVRSAARDAGATAGFVIFADSAFELLPPTSPAAAVLALSRFTAVSPSAERDRLAETATAPRTYESATPWSDAFIGNTEIASGLDLARRALLRSRGARPGGRIVLVSDLQDGGLGATLRSALRRSRRAGIVVDAIPVGSTPTDIANWRRLGGLVANPRVVPRPPAPARADIPSSRASTWTAVAAAGFLLVLAGLYLWSSPLSLASAVTRRTESGA